jgi:hypothetical protein
MVGSALDAACPGRPFYDLEVQPIDGPEPTPISPRRFMLMTAIAVGLYFLVRFTVTPTRSHPALLLVTIGLGAVAGLLVAKWEATRGRRPQQGHRRSVSDARWYVFGLAGAGLLLSQAIPPAALDWLPLGLTALTTGAASHAWLTARRSRTLRSE